MSKSILSQRAMLARLTVRQWSARKLDRKVTDEVNRSHGAGADAGRYNKRLLSADSLLDVARIGNEARAAHYHFTLAWQDDGARILPAAAFLPYSARLKTLRGEFESAVAAFVRGYPDYVADARVRLNGLFDPADYPAVQDVESRFALAVNVLPMPDSDDFRASIGDAQADAIRADIRAQLDAVQASATRQVYERIAESVGRMAERLAAYKPATGSAKAEGIFRDSLVENVRDLVAVLPALNLTGDAGLAALSDRIAATLTQHDAETLRESDSIRSRVATEARAIADHVADFLA